MTQPAPIPLFTSQTKSRDAIQADILRTISNGLRANGVANPNVGPKSDYWYAALGVANEICVGLANGVVSTNNQMPDTSGGTALDRWLANFGLARKPATPSSGVIAPAFSIATGYVNVPGSQVGTAGGAQLTDAAGLVYQVTVGGFYGPGNPPSQPAALYVPVTSVDVGPGTDHANGDTLTWKTQLPFVGPYASVGTTGGTDGLTGGNDSEATQDGPPRNRLFGVMQNPPAGGNWSEVASWVRASTPIVQDGAVYPALLGPATVFFVAWQAPQTSGVLSSTSKNRSVTVATMNGVVVPYVQGKYPARAAVVGASTVDLPVDVALKLSLPAAPTAQPAGPGGGWLDGTPWPSSVSGAPCLVTAVTSSTQFTVNATTPPTPGVSHVAYVSPTNWQLYTATVLTQPSGGSGAYVVTIDTPWPNLATDFANYPQVALFPQSAQQLNYLAAVFAAFGNMGPGEWSTSPPVLVRAFRHPSVSQTWFSALDANFLRTVENAGQEVLSAQWLYSSAGTPPVVPAVPATATITTSEPFTLTSAAPNLFVPRGISWYAA